MASNKLSYKPITQHQFRLVHLLPASSFNAPIRCVLEPRPFGAKVSYDALSYHWGDPTITKPIRLAHLEPSPRTKAVSESASANLPAWSDIKGTQQPNFSDPESLLIDGSLRMAMIGFPFRLVVRELLYRLFCFVLPKQPTFVLVFISWFDVLGKWIEWFLSGLLRLFLGQWLAGWVAWSWGVIPGREIRRLPAWFCAKLAWDVGMDMINYMFWLPDSSAADIQSLPDPVYEAVQVTTNLELALRHLRKTKGIRTLWIDALCINQVDATEKLMQIQRMDAIYANAWEVVVWLGGYHDSPITTCAAASRCDVEGNLDCKHKQDMRIACRTVEWLSSWCPAFLSEEQRRADWINPALPGLKSLSRRAWWTRLWVVQEVALAQGAARVQCGDYTCDFGDLCSALELFASDLGPASNIPSTRQQSSAPWFSMASTVQAIGYSVFAHKRGLYPMTELIRAFLNLDKYDFGQKPPSLFAKADAKGTLTFVSRLQYVLLKTAGRFNCFDDRDRLRAMIGISGGLTGAVKTLMGKPGIPRFVLWVSALCTAWTVYERVMLSLLGDSWALWLVYTVVYWHWGFATDTLGWDWTIAQNKVLVKDDHREVLRHVEENQDAALGNYDSRAMFFTLLAEYLANEMGFLLFLDALSCDQNKKSDGVSLLSWVPNWTTIVADSASDNCVKTSTSHVIRPAFHICREKGELRVCGYARTVDMVKALGNKKKARYNKPRRSGISVPPSDMPESGYLGTVGSRGADGWETGLLIRGRATQGDALVYVPGNFYHLVLSRRAKGDDGEDRWVVVGLVLFKKTEHARDTIVDPRLRHLADLWDTKHLKAFILI